MKIKSEWKISKRLGDNSLVELTDWSKNTILDTGLDYWLDNIGTLVLPFSDVYPMSFTHIAVGGGTAPSDVTDTSLVDEVYRGEIATEYSSVVNNDDPSAPYVILGIEMPSGTEQFSISELGLCNAGDVFFNRYVCEELTKMPEDVLIIQCQITLSLLSETARKSSKVTMNTFLGGTSASYYAYTILLKETLYGLLTMNPTSLITDGTYQLGTGLSIPLITDTGVTTLMEEFTGFPYTLELSTNHSLRLKYGIKPMDLINSEHPTDAFTEISIINWPIQFHTVFEKIPSVISTTLKGLGDDSGFHYGLTYAPMFGIRLEFTR